MRAALPKPSFCCKFLFGTGIHDLVNYPPQLAQPLAIFFNTRRYLLPEGLLAPLSPVGDELLYLVTPSRTASETWRQSTNPNGIKPIAMTIGSCMSVLGRPGHRRPRPTMTSTGAGPTRPQPTESFEAPLRKPVVDDDSVPLHIAQRIEALPEGLGAGEGPKARARYPTRGASLANWASGHRAAWQRAREPG